ncbi:MAG: hypothetical protein H6733_01800 [Alphaproteobacteria bacterium]|nr:hypothetical protein [Alphaproteobacteria bacterium]
MRSWSAVVAALLSVPVAHAGDWAPSAAEREVIQALSAHDGAPPCADLVARLSDPTASLAAIVEHVDSPPTVAVRAARCVVVRDDADAIVRTWLGRTDWAGIARVVAVALPDLPEPRAVALATDALQGPHAARFVTVLRTAPSPALRRLVEAR